MVTGVGYDVAVTMKNTGATTWAPGAYKLGQRDWDHEWMWGIQSVALPASVAPGQQYTFQFKVWGPSPGSHTFQWAMVNVGNEWFGAITNNAVTVTDNLGNVTFIHTDGLGSPVARTDAAGKVISTTRYEPYGYVAGGAAPTVGFTGHVNDVDTGLTYMQQRYYDPVAGRFLSIDPVVTDANTGRSFNRYVYANNSPYKYIDPDGREACPGQSASRCIMADNFDSKKSNGQTTVASEAMGKVMVENKSSVAVPESGSQEKITFVVSDGTSLSVKSGTNVQTGSTSTTKSASATAPAGTVAVLHGHIDGAMNLVSPRDAAPLKQGLPNGVVSSGRVGVTEIVGGRLQFRMLQGSMETRERRDQQKMLDSQQSEFEK